MFIREAKISALLLHPNIVQIYEFGEADGAYFIAMENVQGVTLREALTTLRREQRAMPYMVAADIARQICIGLDYAHTLHGPDGAALEIVHQDISPTNIMLAYNGTVKILDFGIARAASFAEEEAKKGLIKGKVSYLSPEQIHVRPFDARADVFALGVVFHEMLTGRRLFQAKNDIGKMRQLLAAPIPPPSAMNATIPRELDRIVMRALVDRRHPAVPVDRRHGQRSRAHADRRPLLEPRAVEAAARAVPARRGPGGGGRHRRPPDGGHDRDHAGQLVGSQRRGQQSDGNRDGHGGPHAEPALDLAVDVDSASASHSTPGSPGTRPTRRASAPPRRRTRSPIRSRRSRRPRSSSAQPTRARDARSNGWRRRSAAGWLASGCAASCRVLAVVGGIVRRPAVAVLAGVWASRRRRRPRRPQSGRRPPPPKPAPPAAARQAKTTPKPRPRRSQARPARHEEAHAPRRPRTRRRRRRPPATRRALDSAATVAASTKPAQRDLDLLDRRLELGQAARDPCRAPRPARDR